MCGFAGRSLTVFFPGGSKERSEYLNEKPGRAPQEIRTLEKCHSLPPEFIPFRFGDVIDEVPFRRYLETRQIGERIIKLYRMGYATKGELANRVIIPSFDSEGRVNHYVARTIYDVKPPYKEPDTTKEIIVNEHMVSWKEPVVVVEGMFDAIAVGSQAVPLLGKFPETCLVQKFITESTPMVHVCLDSDAEQQAWKIVQELVSFDVPCSLVRLPGKDPSALGPSRVESAINVSIPIRGNCDLIKARIA